MQFPEISFSFLSTQTCTHCELPVTCGPVYVISDLSILCGRCRMTAKDHYRNYAYEALASTFLYPCKNWPKHCPVKLRWNDSLDHEPECSYTGCCTLCRHPGAFFKGTRDMPEDDVRLTIVPENLLEYLECVICRGYLNSYPIFLQSNGQNVCHRCIYSNGNPPNCRRNLAYEKFSRTFLFPCTYRNRGCNEKMIFGPEVWRHEADCDYMPNLNTINRNSSINREPVYIHPNNDFQRPSVKTKEKGIIKTHSGHIWATITPNKALFAPPDDQTQDVNKQLMKSLAKKHGKHRKRADEIGNEMGRRNSDSESVSTNDSYNYKNSNNGTPELLQYVPPEDHRRSPSSDSRPNSRESGYHTGHSKQRYPDEYGYNQGLRPNDSFREMNGTGQYPVLKPHQLSDSYDSLRRTSNAVPKRVSASGGNSLLINELKLRQDMIKRTHSIKGDKDVNALSNGQIR